MSEFPLRILRLSTDRSEASHRPSTDHLDDDLASSVRRFAAVDGLVFDMGDVLFDATDWRRRLLQVLQRMGLHAGYRSLFELWDRDYLDAVHRGEREYAEAFVSFLRHAGLTTGQVDEVVAVSQQIKRQCEAEVRPFPGVRETLQRLRDRNLRMAVLSDSESTATAIVARLHKLGLGDFFSEVVSSFDLRRTKPHPLGYLTALERLGLRPNQAAFVGHDVDELGGARRCGLRTIAFNYDRGASADCRIARFQDLFLLFADRRLAGDAPCGKAA